MIKAQVILKHGGFLLSFAGEKCTEENSPVWSSGFLQEQLQSLYAETEASLDGAVLRLGEPTSLGNFEMVLNLEWSSDGTWLVFCGGPWDNQKVMAVDVSDWPTTVNDA